MSERQTPETLERSSDPSRVNKDRAQGWGSDDTKVDAIRTVTLYPGSENPQEAISPFGWLSASILHDLRNPLGTICAGAELLINLDSTSTQVKRLAGNMARAAGRMQQLLAELASLARDNVSTPEICDIRQVIAGAAEAALAAMGNQSLQIQLDVPVGIESPLVRSHIERVFFNLIVNAIEAMPCCGKVRVGARKVGACIHGELEDTGPGIADCIRDRLFEPFITSGEQNGLGLGLALRVRLFATTAATYGLNQPLAPVSSSVFRCIKPAVPFDGLHLRRIVVGPHNNAPTWRTASDIRLT